MKIETEERIALTDIDKKEAISTFMSVYSMAKLKMILKKYLKKARENIRQRKMGK